MQNVRKVRFSRLESNGTPSIRDYVDVQYNPTEYTLNKGMQFAEIPIPGLDAPLLQFVRGQSETMTMELFFDSTEQGTGTNARSVTLQTDRFYQLIKIDSHQHAPSVLQVEWGGRDFPGSHMGTEYSAQNRPYSLRCVVESVRQRFTLFNPNGVPLRATLTVTLKEYKTLQEQIAQLNLQSADQTKAHVVQEGETLTQIAARAYDDPREWRTIAAYNGIIEPLALQAGMVLHLPPTEWE